MSHHHDAGHTGCCGGHKREHGCHSGHEHEQSCCGGHEHKREQGCCAGHGDKEQQDCCGGHDHSHPEDAHDHRHEGGCRCAGHDQEQATGSGRRQEGPALPAVNFSTFVLSLASSALVQLGEVPDPATGESQENIPLARHSIDLLSMLQDKTKNGLDAEESRLLEGLLYELRMKFVVKK